MTSLADRIRQMETDLQEQAMKSLKDKDEYPSDFGSMFISNKIPKGVEFWQPDRKHKTVDGRHLVDIIPHIAGPNNPKCDEGKGAYKVDYWRHAGYGPNATPFCCTSKTWKERDAACDYLALRNLDKDVWNRLRSKRYTSYLVWPHDTPELEREGIKIWDVAHWFFENHIAELQVNPEGGGILSWYTSSEEGLSIAFSIDDSGHYEDDSGQKRQSFTYKGHRFFPRKKAIPSWVLEQSFSLDEAMILRPSYEDTEKWFYGAVGKKRIDETQNGEPSSKNEERKSEPIERPSKDHLPDECPSGHRFGEIKEHPECDSCVVFDNCSDFHDMMKRDRMKDEEPQKTEPESAPAEESPRTPSPTTQRKGIIRRRRDS